MSETFGEIIREVRAQRGLTQAEAAATCGVSTRSWQRWEAGPTIPRAREARMVSAGLGLSTYRMLCAREAQRNPEELRERS